MSKDVLMLDFLKRLSDDSIILVIRDWLRAFKRKRPKPHDRLDLHRAIRLARRELLLRRELMKRRR